MKDNINIIVNKNETWTAFWLWMALFSAIMAALGAACGAKINRDIMREDAVKAGVGRFVIANTNLGISAFEWITNRVE